MCKYIELTKGKCKINQQSCPFVYFCPQILSYKPSKEMTDECKIKKSQELPKDSYLVCFERRKQLYVEVDGYIQIVDNPFDYVPYSVKLIKTKNGKWKVKTR